MSQPANTIIASDLNQKTLKNIKGHLLEIWKILEAEPGLNGYAHSNLLVVEQYLSDSFKKLKKWAAQYEADRQSKMFIE